MCDFSCLILVRKEKICKSHQIYNTRCLSVVAAASAVVYYYFQGFSAGHKRIISYSSTWQKYFPLLPPFRRWTPVKVIMTWFIIIWMDGGELIAFDGASRDDAEETRSKLTGNIFHGAGKKNLSCDSIMCSLNHRWCKHFQSSHQGEGGGVTHLRDDGENVQTLCRCYLEVTSDNLFSPTRRKLFLSPLWVSGSHTDRPHPQQQRAPIGPVLKSSDLGHDSFVQSACSTCWFDCHFQFSHDPSSLGWGISGRKWGWKLVPSLRQLRSSENNAKRSSYLHSDHLLKQDGCCCGRGRETKATPGFFSSLLLCSLFSGCCRINNTVTLFHFKHCQISVTIRCSKHATRVFRAVFFFLKSRSRNIPPSAQPCSLFLLM